MAKFGLDCVYDLKGLPTRLCNFLYQNHVNTKPALHFSKNTLGTLTLTHTFFQSLTLTTHFFPRYKAVIIIIHNRNCSDFSPLNIDVKIVTSM